MLQRKFLLAISLVKVDKKCHMGGGGEGGSKKSRKSVTYYLNGPLTYLTKPFVLERERERKRDRERERKSKIERERERERNTF